MGIFVEPAERIRVSLLTGFLGSGKTTLLNALLRHPDLARTAVVINEFGDVALDQLFVEKSDGEVTVLANGCLCCDVQGDLEGVIGTLFGRRETGGIPAFDRMIIETTGLADPAPIMQMLLNQPIIVDNFHLDSVMTTIDAVHGLRQLAEHDEAVKQAALADRLVLTKTDLVTAEDASAVEQQLHKLNPAAPLVRANRIAPGDLFGLGRGGPRHVDVPPLQSHLHGIDTFSLTFDEPVEWRAFSAWLTTLKIRHADQLLRVKGVIHVAGEETPIAIHGVHHVFHPPARLAGLQLADSTSRIVFITRGLSREQVEADWHCSALAETR